MHQRLEAMKQGWLDTVSRVVNDYCRLQGEQLALTKREELEQEREANVDNVINDACCALKRQWSNRVTNELSSSISCRIRGKTIFCDVMEEMWEPESEEMEIYKFNIGQVTGSAFSRFSRLGTIRLDKDEHVLLVYTIQVSSILMISVSDKATHIRHVHFLDESISSYSTHVVNKLRTFKRVSIMCDFSIKDRMIVFFDAIGSASLYRFNEQYKALEVVRTIDIGAKTSLVMPLKTVLLDDGVMHMVGAKGNVQSINVRNQQLSRKSAKCCFGVEGVTWRGPLFAILDGLVLGSVGCMQDDSGSYRGFVEAISSEDYRALRQRTRDGIVLGSSEKLSVQAFGNEVVVFDEESTKLRVIKLQASVRSDSFRIRKMKSGIDENEGSGAAVGTSSFSSHWLWVFYHLFEKFPVRGALYSSERGAPEQLQLQINGRAESQDKNELSGAVAGYLDRIMEELEKLHKPLYGLNLAQNHHVCFSGSSMCDDDPCSFAPALYDCAMLAFLQNLVTFVPIQICRAEYNTLSAMQNGRDRSEDIAGSSPKDLQSADIARSIRFGLLSPLLQSWGGQCVVVTSMGKQSTGKSYFLNHLTGSSFAIAGARCTDGAWMSVRVLDSHVLLVVIDFEGLGSFERTEQEDVFLSVLNASISMLTVFRMEMRLDKEIDDLFSKFQKGSQLIKNESQNYFVGSSTCR